MKARLRAFLLGLLNVAIGLLVCVGLLALFLLAYWFVSWLSSKGLFPRIRTWYD